MRNMKDYTAGEHLFYALALISFVSSPFMFVGGIWSDPRWVWTSLFAVVMGFCFAAIAEKMK